MAGDQGGCTGSTWLNTTPQESSWRGSRQGLPHSSTEGLPRHEGTQGHRSARNRPTTGVASTGTSAAEPNRTGTCCSTG